MKAICIFITVMMVVCVQSVEGKLKATRSIGFNFINLPVSAVLEGAGRANITDFHDAGSIFVNPAVVANINIFSMYYSYSNDDIGHAFISGSIASCIRKLGVLAAFFQCRNFDIRGYGDNFESTSYSLGIGLSRKVSERLSIGIKLSKAKYDYGSATETVVLDTDEQGNPIAVGERQIFVRDDALFYDIGFVFDTFLKGIKFGGVLKDYSLVKEQDLFAEGYYLAKSYKFGMSTNLMELLNLYGVMNNHKTTVYTAMQYSDVYDFRMHYGIEYGYKTFTVIRMGYKANNENEGFTLGLGIGAVIGNVHSNINYAYLVNEVQSRDDLHQFSMSISF